MGKRKTPAPEQQNNVEKLRVVVEHLAREVRTLYLVMDEIRADLLHAVRNPAFDPAVSSGEYQHLLDQIGEAVGEVEDEDAPIGTRKIIRVTDETPRAKPTDESPKSLFD